MAPSAASAGLSRLGAILLAVGAGISGAGCGHPAPRPLVEGAEVCAHCHMTMVERRFAAELVSTTGRVTPFDDVGCLAMGVIAADSNRIASLWAADFLAPDSLVAVERMVFLRTDALRTPMNYGMIAVRPGPAADSLAQALGGVRLSWQDVMAWARDSGAR